MNWLHFLKIRGHKTDKAGQVRTQLEDHKKVSANSSVLLQHKEKKPNSGTQLHEADTGQTSTAQERGRLFKHLGPGENNQPNDHERLKVPEQIKCIFDDVFFFFKRVAVLDDIMNGV